MSKRRMDLLLRGETIACSYEDGVLFAPLYVEDDERTRQWFTSGELQELAASMEHYESELADGRYKENDT